MKLKSAVSPSGLTLKHIFKTSVLCLIMPILYFHVYVCIFMKLKSTASPSGLTLKPMFRNSPDFFEHAYACMFMKLKSAVSPTGLTLKPFFGKCVFEHVYVCIRHEA